MAFEIRNKLSTFKKIVIIIIIVIAVAVTFIIIIIIIIVVIIIVIIIIQPRQESQQKSILKCVSLHLSQEDKGECHFDPSFKKYGRS